MVQSQQHLYKPDPLVTAPLSIELSRSGSFPPLRVRRWLAVSVPQKHLGPEVDVLNRERRQTAAQQLEVSVPPSSS